MELEKVWGRTFKIEVSNPGRDIVDIYFTESLESVIYDVKPTKMSVDICFALLNDEDEWLKDYDGVDMTLEEAKEFLEKLSEIYAIVKIVKV